MPDPSSSDCSKVIVWNIPPGIEWQDLKDHFSTIGSVAHSNVKPMGGCKGGKGIKGGKGMMNQAMFQMMPWAQMQMMPWAPMMAMAPTGKNVMPGKGMIQNNRIKMNQGTPQMMPMPSSSKK